MKWNKNFLTSHDSFIKFHTRSLSLPLLLIITTCFEARPGLALNQSCFVGGGKGSDKEESSSWAPGGAAAKAKRPGDATYRPIGGKGQDL
jgi:hypothetical protein